MVCIIEDTDEFNKKITENKSKLIVIDFYTDWCQPCKNIAPDFEKLSEYYKDNVIFLKIDVDNNNCDKICQKFEVSSMPTFIFLLNYRYMVNYRIEGADIDQINKNIQQLLLVMNNQDNKQ